MEKQHGLNLTTALIAAQEWTVNKMAEWEVMPVWEDMFELYRVVNGKIVEKMASNMRLDNVALFVSAWFGANFSDQVSSLEIRRQPMDGKYTADDYWETVANGDDV